jgi:hypothetical protein
MDNKQLGQVPLPTLKGIKIPSSIDGKVVVKITKSRTRPNPFQKKQCYSGNIFMGKCECDQCIKGNPFRLIKDMIRDEI